ncbi:MAG: four-carbon acid sugar kinase family protein [Rhodospirillales bacterium]
MLLGCIADDVTGASDLALMLAEGGLRTRLAIGLPGVGGLPPDSEAVVIALKSRTIPADDAVAQSLQAAEILLQAGAERLFFKYCSTFDSRDEGNIGPVGDALLARTGAAITIACPAFPANGRSVYQGHLFVGQTLLSDSPLRDHPLTPMRDSNLVAVLGRQTPHPVGLIPWDLVRQGGAVITEALERLGDLGVRYAVVDALDEDNLRAIAMAIAKLPLITGGSGIALGLPAALTGKADLVPAQVDLPRGAGPTAILAGSCSAATRGQIAQVEGRWPTYRLDPLSVDSPDALAEAALGWAAAQGWEQPLLIAASAGPEEVAAVQARLGRDAAGHFVESALSRIAVGLRARGLTRLLLAGGETSGAIVSALGIESLEIGPAIDPGVPWCLLPGDPPLALALKSGNFGTPDFFEKALERLA